MVRVETHPDGFLGQFRVNPRISITLTFVGSIARNGSFGALHIIFSDYIHIIIVEYDVITRVDAIAGDVVTFLPE